MNSTNYETPHIEKIEIDVEKGFAGSQDVWTEGQFGNAEDGGEGW